MQTCVYITNEHPFYMAMVCNSINMLRKYNKEIPIKLFFIEDKGKNTSTTSANKHLKKFGISKNQFDTLCDAHCVDVQYRKEIDPECAHLNRYYISECTEPDVLYIDCDTFIFGDVQKLFSQYEEEDMTTLIHGSIANWNEDWLPLDPVNTAVVLGKNHSYQKICKHIPEYSEKLKKKQIYPEIASWMFEWCEKGNDREELATSILIHELKMTNNYFNKEDARNIKANSDIVLAHKSIIFHSYSQQWPATYHQQIKNPILSYKRGK